MANMLHDFGVNKTEHLKRSTWNLPLKHQTAFKQGALIPFAWCDVIPGSQISCDVNELIRLALTPKRPFFNEMYFSYGAYWVPYRVLYKKYPEMFGNGKPSEWSDPQEYVMPTMQFDVADVQESGGPVDPGAGYDGVVNSSVASSSTDVYSEPGNLANYLGLPAFFVDAELSGIVGYEINAAPFLAYERIWSDFWRDENYQNIDPDLELGFEASSGDDLTYTLKCCLHYANKFHDYFTSMLPNTQKGEAITIPLGDFAPVVMENTGDAKILRGSLNIGGVNINIDSDETLEAGDIGGITYNDQSIGEGKFLADLRNVVGGADVSNLRMAIALQRAEERNARTGSRSMNEAMKGIYEAQAPAVLNMAEFLGGSTIKLNLMSVPQTGDNAGELGAFSATSNSAGCFRKYFYEPGILMFVGTVRVKHLYKQGIDKYWFKKRRYDFYDPALAHISEQPVYARELNAGSTANNGNDVIGFNEAWVEYVKPVHKVTGFIADSSKADLSAWALQDALDNATDIDPTSFYVENGNEVAKLCGDYNSSFDSFQFIGDFDVELTITAPKPVYSVPGFIDHLIA